MRNKRKNYSAEEKVAILKRHWVERAIEATKPGKRPSNHVSAACA